MKVADMSPQLIGAFESRSGQTHRQQEKGASKMNAAFNAILI